MSICDRSLGYVSVLVPDGVHCVRVVGLVGHVFLSADPVTLHVDARDIIIEGEAEEGGAVLNCGEKVQERQAKGELQELGVHRVEQHLVRYQV